MLQVKRGDRVKFTCRSFLENGTALEKDTEIEPIFLKAGISQEKSMKQIVSRALVDMWEKQSKTVEVPPELAFGEYNSELLFEIPKDMAPKDISNGERLVLKLGNGKEKEGTVTNVSPNGIEVDANHPLAGKKLLLTINILDIEKEGFKAS